RNNLACEPYELLPRGLGVFAGPEFGIEFGLVFRFPRRCRPSGGGAERVTPDQVLVRQPLADHGPYHVEEALAIVGLPAIEAERLLIKVAEEVERLDADVGAPDRALEQAPEVLQPVHVHVVTHV